MTRRRNSSGADHPSAARKTNRTPTNRPSHRTTTTMYDPRPQSPIRRPTWKTIAASYLVVAAFPSLLWGVANPAGGAVLLATLVALSLAARRGSALARCAYVCEELSFDVGGAVRVTVTKTRG